MAAIVTLTVHIHCHIHTYSTFKLNSPRKAGQEVHISGGKSSLVGGWKCGPDVGEETIKKIRKKEKTKNSLSIQQVESLQRCPCLESDVSKEALFH